MLRRTSTVAKHFAAALALLSLMFGWSLPSHAYIQQVVVDSMHTDNFSPVPMGSSVPGPAVNYTVYTGRVFGVLDPNNAEDSVIQDLNLASPVGSNPKTSYVSVFHIITPTDPTKRNGLLIYWVVNRGIIQMPINAMVEGATYVESGWQGDVLSLCSGAPNSQPVRPYPCIDMNLSQNC
jgi:hypothetical protein